MARSELAVKTVSKGASFSGNLDVFADTRYLNPDVVKERQRQRHVDRIQAGDGNLQIGQGIAYRLCLARGFDLAAIYLQCDRDAALDVDVAMPLVTRLPNVGKTSSPK